MFRTMRRKRQALDEKTCRKILENGSAGVLALYGDDGYPYAVPISYALEGDTLFFHSAKSGHKIDAIKRGDKASFCVIDQDEIVPARLTTYFRSVIAFGRVRIVEPASEKRRGIEALAKKYAPDIPQEEMDREIDRTWKALTVLALDVEHCTGKEAIELVEKKEGSCL
ncbi:pyridoxamine 5'-phosphate oxidase family protein [uncultured Dubosiella sp.]|uniref:pyridoxamine 5'-phosphate oxidase family protein n=1 Tax=uncultured Dubosiella sp. TaxID=1937011 RepID=UPI002597DD8F|nr:pyridoxamine 5'-phosphate oxidase family protein [uncultured Dubosiella sp.]